MSNKPENPPAFPRPMQGDKGMTLRDYFAAAALQGIMASIARDFIIESAPQSPERVKEAINTQTQMAFILADAMLKARSL